MSYIDDVTNRAIEVGLMQEIDRLLFQLTSHNFDNIKKYRSKEGQRGQVFHRLEEAISDGEDLLRKMRKCLDALNALEYSHSAELQSPVHK